MVSVRDCADGGGIPTAGHGGGAFCDGGVHTGKPITAILQGVNAGLSPAALAAMSHLEVQKLIDDELAAHLGQKRPPRP